MVLILTLLHIAGTKIYCTWLPFTIAINASKKNLVVFYNIVKKEKKKK